MFGEMTWKDQYVAHRQQAIVFKTRAAYFAAQAKRDKAAKMFLDANQHRILAQEYRAKAIQERNKAAEIKRLHLTTPNDEQQ
jgi:hypothetical protein